MASLRTSGGCTGGRRLGPRPEAILAASRGGSLAALGVLVLLAAACGRPKREVRSSLDLADLVAHQRRNVSTQLISPPAGTGLGDLGPGWRLTRDHAGEPIAEMDEKVGRLRVYAPEGDVAALEAELGWPPGAQVSAAKVTVQLNLAALAEVAVAGSRSTLRLELPSDRVHRGLNVVDLRREESSPRLWLRRVRVVPASGRPLWPRRPDHIRVLGGDSVGGVERVVEMPTASALDMVLRLPREARLRGAFSFEPAPDENFESVEVSVTLLDEGGREHGLLEEHVVGTVERPRSVEVDLSQWTGELARLRWTVKGPGNGLLRWHQAGVRSSETGLAPPPVPIERVVPPRSGRLGRPDVIVILLDAARADAFSPFGGPHETPATARLAADGTVFRHAVAGSSWTLPSVSSLLTGLHADALGVGGWRDRLPADVPTLPEMLSSVGYRTVLFSQHPFYEHDPSYRRGFQAFRGRQGPTELPRRQELMSSDPERPTFALVHLLPPHAPYTPPAPFRGRYTEGYAGKMRADPRHLRSVNPSRPDRPSEGDVRYVLGRYQENVAFADSLVGRILAMLDRHGRYDDALVVLLADHGEAFLEHGVFLHSQNVHWEALHVPLVVKWPRSVGAFRSEVDEPVSLLDLVPTLVDGLSLSSADHGYQGRSLLPAVFDGHREERALYAERGVGSPTRAAIPHLMLESDGWRVLYTPLDDRARLYRVDRDPREDQDLAPKHPLRALLARQSLLIQAARNRDLLQRDAAQEAAELGPERVEQLEALGYLP